MPPFQLNIPPHVAEVIRSFDPTLTPLIKSAIRTIVAKPGCGTPLQLELTGLYKYRVRRFCIIYATVPRKRLLQLMAVSHYRYLYEGLAERLS